MVDCSGFIEPLNLECIFVNIFSGSWLIFAVVALLVISIIAAKFRMGSSIFGITIVLFAIMFYETMAWLLWLAIIFLTISIGITIAKLFK